MTMPGGKKRRGVGMTAASGLVFDSEFRRAALKAAPPMARLGYTLGKRMASRQAHQQLTEASEGLAHLCGMLTSAGPQLAEQLGLVDPPRRSRRWLPAAGAVAVVAVAVVLATDPARRRRVQRLVVH
jgi:hypothetical protein